MSDKAIIIKNLNKSFGDFKAVDDLEFQVEKTECFGLLGPNGAGKTTTMKIIYGKSEHDENRETIVDVFGHNPKKQSLVIKSFSGIVPQQDNLDTELNVTENLNIYSKFYGIPPREAKKRIDELLSFMELQEKAKSNVRELSGGMQRRLTIARALINKPKLLILDEPTTGLDPQVRHLIWNKLRDLKEMGVTILLTTHYMEEAFQICDRIIIMDKGKKMLEGKPRELLSTNLEKHVMELYGVSKDGSDSTKALDAAGIRYEFHKDTLFAYSNDSEKLAQIGEMLKESEYYIRHSNLEDLFLKVTGRSLNELQ
ncbi:MAG: ATP-binding cassette domain-containing protein [Clostridia bacterium]|nr:ATP-binding cassette domain-containing protein [Clostridia bacterium]